MRIVYIIKIMQPTSINETICIIGLTIIINHDWYDVDNCHNIHNMHNIYF
jgi:hypothetical protein